MEHTKNTPISNDRFDRYSWKPTVVHTQEELNQAIESFGIAGKRIKHINVIGASENLSRSKLYREAEEILAKPKPVPPKEEDRDLRRKKNLLYNKQCLLWAIERNNVPLPCEATVFEPVVIVFADDSTLELRPEWGSCNGLLVAHNQISPTTKDGLNHSTFDSAKMFAGAAGSVIEGITLTVSDYHNTTHIHLSGNYDLLIDGWHYNFLFGMIQKDTGDPAVMPCKDICRHVHGYDQILIREGTNSFNSSLSIFPMHPLHDALFTEEISIREEDVFHYLYHFLNKYFDIENPYGSAHDAEFREDGKTFYPFETVRAMLDEIEEYACRPMPSSIGFYLDYFQERACDFYERFVHRMRRMMDSVSESEPHIDMICFKSYDHNHDDSYIITDFPEWADYNDIDYDYDYDLF